MLTHFVMGHQGMGDSIFQRPFVRAVAARGRTQIQTPWPELFEDLGVEFVMPEARLRTQSKNIARQPRSRWTPIDQLAQRVKPKYSYLDLEKGVSITSAMEGRCPLGETPYIFDLPPALAGPPPIVVPRPFAVLRPVTERSEWRAAARAPDPEYIAEAARILRRRGWTVVSVADLSGQAEWLVGPEPEVDVALHKGELALPELVRLCSSADLLVGGVGWVVPLAIAAGVPLITIFGGCGAHNRPALITDPRMDLSRTSFLLPDQFCPCALKDHRCRKAITDFPKQFVAALERVAVCASS